MKPIVPRIADRPTHERWRLRLVALSAVLGLLLPVEGQIVEGADWPQWRYDAQHSAASPEDLPANLAIHWQRDLPKLTPAWPDQPKMPFDAVYEPIVVGQQMIVGSSHEGSVTSYDTASGDVRWTFFAEGPVRFAPLAHEDRLYFVSDDGYLYCLNAADGSLVWRFRGGPSNRNVLGNERLISTWPARGAPVVAEGKVYFAAGIWPFMGIFLHALDAQTGEVVWTNDGDGSLYIKQPHNTDSFAGVAPQGPLAAIGDKLLIPGGRSVPACYDRTTGMLLYYALAENAKKGGGSEVAASNRLIFNGGEAFDLATEKHLGSIGEHIALTGERLYAGEGSQIRELDLTSSMVKEEITVDRKGETVKSTKWSIRELGKAAVPDLTAMIAAGSRLYVGSAGKLAAYDLPLSKDENSKPAWEIAIEGTPGSLVAADGKLLAATLEGRIYCLADAAAAPAGPKQHGLPAEPLATNEAARAKVAGVLRESKVRDGYALVWGGASEELVGELLKQSQLRVVVVEPDAKAARALRTRLSAAGLAGERASVIVPEPEGIELPPYFASLVLVDSLPSNREKQSALVAKLYASLRPFGGAMCLPVDSDESKEFVEAGKSLNLEQATWTTADEQTLVVREGALPGSADWTHEHADASNTRVSKDSRVKAPLGLLWFGGAGNDAILPRHGHGPQPQVVDGRLFIEGMDMIRAIDIYTGRVLWEATLPGVGELYNNTAHQPGANSSGTNYIATQDGVYVALGNSCVVLDPATGERIAEHRLPVPAGGMEPPKWGYISVFEDYLVGGSDPLFNPDLASARGENDNHSFSRGLTVLDRASGKVLWSAMAKSGFRHNAICIGGGRLYAIDRMSGPELARLKRRGEESPHKPRLIAFDLASGKELWSTEQDVFGTWLSYSAERDLLVEAGRVASDTISDEPKGMRVYPSAGGASIWENKSYTGPAMIHHDTILMAGKACDLLTGAPRMREHPLTGESVEWTWSRNYGCNTPMASENLLTFRSGAAGYFDLCTDGGTGNFGGFRSSCSNNLVVAGGVLTAPDYTRTCTCSYQNQTSIALVPTADVETWTSFGSQSPSTLIRRLGVNLAAPGDRKTDDGTLWLDYPSVGGASPSVVVRVEPAEPEWFRRHSSQVSGPGLNWVAASGAKGLTKLTVKLAERPGATHKYTVRLHFMEPDDVEPGERVFGVAVQGAPAIEALDVAREAGGTNRSLVKEIASVEATDRIIIDLAPAATSKVPAAVLSGIEVQIEGP
jgi:outer membrane protein assembly factor BamB